MRPEDTGLGTFDCGSDCFGTGEVVAYGAGWGVGVADWNEAGTFVSVSCVSCSCTGDGTKILLLSLSSSLVVSSLVLLDGVATVSNKDDDEEEGVTALDEIVESEEDGVTVLTDSTNSIDSVAVLLLGENVVDGVE